MQVLIFIKIIIPLFALNSIILYNYFSFNHASHHRRVADSSPINIRYRRPHLSKASANIPPKAWPVIPSYMPWSLNPNVALNSCEAYFGNGFTKVADILPAKLALRARSSWFRCHYSETLRSSICEGGKIMMDPGKIEMSRGGEKLEDVLGRREEDELPRFKDGAFVVEGEGGSRLKRNLVRKKLLDKLLPAPDEPDSTHPIRELVRSIVVGGANDFDCEEWVEGPALLVTRVEYANLFHTVTDWYSAYVASRVTGLPNRPHLVFVDGHCETQLDETWNALFSSLRYAKSFTGPVCFNHVIFSPMGYETPLFRGLDEEINCHGVSAHHLKQTSDVHKTARLSEFGEMIRAAFGLPLNRRHVGKEACGHNVVFVRRENYLAHPRNEGSVEQRLSNEKEVLNSVSSWASNHPKCKVSLINGLFAHMPMKEQVRTIQDASVIVGAHGAGLTHLVSATPETVLLEIFSPKFKRPHFQLIAQWKGLEAHGIFLRKVRAEPQVVINRLNSIMSSLGC